MSLSLKLIVDEFNLRLVKPSARSIYEFEQYRLDAEHLMLYRDDAEISLTPKQVETLLALVERCGEIVSKEVLMSRLWGNTAVEESNLVQHIHFLRKVLGDASDGRQMIETLRRRGYRFNGRVHAPEPLPAAEPPVGQQPPPTAPTTIAARGKFAAAAIAATLAIAVLFGYLVYPTSSSTAPNKTLFAVLPLKPIDAANRSDLLEFGVADALIIRMNSIAGFFVRPLSSTRGYAGIEQDPLAAGREQKVDYVLAGNYQAADGRIRITTQLYNVATGEVEQTETIEKEASGVFEIQNAVAAAVGNNLMAKFGTRPNGSPAARVTDNEEAYGSYLLAQNFIEKRGLENGRKALEQIERAVSLDPNFARAWATKGYIHRYIGYGAGAHEQYLKTKEAVEKALAIDPNLSEAHSVLCFNKSRYEYDFAGAESACRRALELDPNSPLAHKLYANFLYTRGRFDESFAEIKKAMDLQPVSYDNQQTYALALYFAGRYDEEEALWKQLFELNPEHIPIITWLARSLQQQGREQEAFEFVIKKLTMEKADDETIERFKFAYRTSGWSGVTRERIKMAEAKPYPDSFEIACLYSTIGDKDKAFANLEKAYQQRSIKIAVLRVEPQLDFLRDDARYADLIRRVEGK